MSITAETAKEHAKDPAVLCCRAEEGITIQASNLEDPAIFDDLVDSGLLDLTGALTIEQVLGAKLKKTCDSLCPLTAEVVEGIAVQEQPDTEEKEAMRSEAEQEAEAQDLAADRIQEPQTVIQNSILKIHIGEGKDIDIELPVAMAGGVQPSGTKEMGIAKESTQPVQAAEMAEEATEEKTVRNLTRKHYKITEVKRGPETVSYTHL